MQAQKLWIDTPLDLPLLEMTTPLHNHFKNAPKWLFFTLSALWFDRSLSKV